MYVSFFASPSLHLTVCLSVFNYECHLHLTISYPSLSLSLSLTRYCPSFSDPLLSLSLYLSLPLSLSPLSISNIHTHTHTHTSSACDFDIKSKKQNRSLQKQNRAPTFYPCNKLNFSVKYEGAEIFSISKKMLKLFSILPQKCYLSNKNMSRTKAGNLTKKEDLVKTCSLLGWTSLSKIIFLLLLLKEVQNEEV